MRPNPAVNRTRRFMASTWRASLCPPVTLLVRPHTSSALRFWLRSAIARRREAVTHLASIGDAIRGAAAPTSSAIATFALIRLGRYRFSNVLRAPK